MKKYDQKAKKTEKTKRFERSAKMKKLCCLLLAIIVVTSIVPCALSESVDYSNYTTGLFSYDIPSFWLFSDSSNGVKLHYGKRIGSVSDGYITVLEVDASEYGANPTDADIEKCLSECLQAYNPTEVSEFSFEAYKSKLFNFSIDKNGSAIPFVGICIYAKCKLFLMTYANSSTSDSTELFSEFLEHIVRIKVNDGVQRSPTVIEGDIGDCHVIIDDAYIAQNSSKENCLVVHYIFSHSSNEAKAFSFSVRDMVFQDGIELDKAYFLDGVDSATQTRSIKANVQYDVYVAYILRNESSRVDVEVGQLFSFGDSSIISKSFLP